MGWLDNNNPHCRLIFGGSPTVIESISIGINRMADQTVAGSPRFPTYYRWSYVFAGPPRIIFLENICGDRVGR